jgi:CMP-N-acetylneuraminic acid synthetase
MTANKQPPIVAFVPCRAGSERIARKNTRAFADEPDGLIGIKLRQLQCCQSVDRIVLSTNDPLVIETARQRAHGTKPIEIIERPEHLCLSSTSTDELVRYVPSIIPEGIVLWTHVTSPLVASTEYDLMIDAYLRNISSHAHDSLMSVTELRSFLWGISGPLNYDRTKEKWPRTQTLEPVFVVNSAAFIIDVTLMRQLGDRVGERPVLFKMGETISYEIDWEEQFTIAESLYRLRRDQSAAHPAMPNFIDVRSGTLQRSI